MESSDHPGRGGYAAVKATLEQQKRRAASQGIDTVMLDAGDFSEGSPFFFADEGKQSWRVIDAMGYDAVTIGNHDWLVGPEQMNRIAASIRPRTPFLAANMNFSAEYEQLKRAVRPYVELERGGMRVAVLGATTDELVYRWRMNNNGGIDDPAVAANRYLPQLRARNDLVILLTHLGAKTDVKILSKIRGADLLVGGHSHTTLHAPIVVKDAEGRMVPIVQTGSHGDWVGKMLVDVESGQPMKVVSYELVPVESSNGNSVEGASIQALVSETRRLLEQRYSKEWLYDTIGVSSYPMERPKDATTAWGAFFMETVRQTAKADIAVDPGEFHGASQPAGVITPENLMNSYPRVFEMKNPMGWNVWKIKVPGWMIQLLVDQVVKQGLHLNTAGLTFDVESTAEGASAKNIKVQGRKVQWLKTYSMAVTEGIGRGAVEICFLLQLLFHPKDTGVPVWAALEKRLRANGGDFVGATGSSPLGLIQ
jgi:2',3'-cyclic-nucleotide 2'-phosphodiesterase (5'-nucleotidase family)